MFVGFTDDAAALTRQRAKTAPERGIDGQPTRLSYDFQTAAQKDFQIMNKLLIALVAGLFAAVAGAQTPAATGQMKQDQVKSTTQAAANVNTGATAAQNAEKNVAKSKKHTKAKGKKHKQDMTKSATTAAANANTGATTAAMGAKNTAKSKADSAMMKPAPQMGTPAADKAMEKASTK